MSRERDEDRKLVAGAMADARHYVTVEAPKGRPMGRRDFVVDSIAHGVAMAQALYVERRILEGDNEVTVRDVAGRTVVYSVPRWTREPLKRLRVEWARAREEIDRRRRA